MKKILSLIIVMLLLTACDSSKKYEMIDANKALELINNGVTIIDVRTYEEYNEGHIINAINIPLDSLDSIDLDKDAPIILYCASGIRSTQAAEYLSDLGYSNIYNLDGGILNAGELLGE